MLLFLSDYIATYVNLESHTAQDGGMLFEVIINSMSSEAKYTLYNRSDDFLILGEESGVLLIKTILDESGLQTHATVMKENAVLENLPELMVRLNHNVSNFNSRVISNTQTLKRNGSSALGLLHQLLLAYLIYLDTQFHDYVVLK